MNVSLTYKQIVDADEETCTVVVCRDQSNVPGVKSMIFLETYDNCQCAVGNSASPRFLNWNKKRLFKLPKPFISKEKLLAIKKKFVNLASLFKFNSRISCFINGETVRTGVVAASLPMHCSELKCITIKKKYSLVSSLMLSVMPNCSCVGKQI